MALQLLFFGFTFIKRGPHNLVFCSLVFCSLAFYSLVFFSLMFYSLVFCSLVKNFLTQ